MVIFVYKKVIYSVLAIWFLIPDLIFQHNLMIRSASGDPNRETPLNFFQIPLDQSPRRTIPQMFRQFPHQLSKRTYATLRSTRGTSSAPLRIGLIPADGIGKEVIPVPSPTIPHSSPSDQLIPLSSCGAFRVTNAACLGSSKSPPSRPWPNNLLQTPGRRVRLFSKDRHRFTSIYPRCPKRRSGLCSFWRSKFAVP